MNVNDYFQRVFNPEDHTKKVDLKVFSTMVEANDYTYLVEISLALCKIILGNRQTTVSLPKLLKFSSSQQINQNSTSAQSSQSSTYFLQAFSEPERIHFFQCLMILKQKLKHTIYQHKISAVIQSCSKKAPKKIQQYFNIKDLQGLQLQKSTNKLFQDLQLPQKMHQIIKNPNLINGKFTSPSTLYFFIYQDVLPWAQKYIITIGDQNQRFIFVKHCLQFLNKVIHQFQLQITISKNTLVQSRIYNAKVQTQFLIRQQQVIDKAAPIINEAILCPSNMDIQLLLFRILRRMYYLWGGRIKFPLFLTIKSISLYSQTDMDIKQPAMFIYKIINQKSDLQLSNLLNNCQELRFIKQSKFFSSKAYAYCNQLYPTYDTNNLCLPFWHYYLQINSHQMFRYNILVEKPSTLIAWQLQLLAYDVRFGIYKVDNASQYTIQDYQSNNKCKQIIKLEKIQKGPKQTIKGMTFLKNGLYHIVIDNTFSLIRSKQIVYMFAHLQVES